MPRIGKQGSSVKGRVVHVSREPYEVYIGRANGFKRLKASKWAKGMDGSREEVIAKYEAYIRQRPDLLADLHELDGKVLSCWRAPKPCHGHVLLRLIEELGLGKQGSSVKRGNRL
jgi:hypothetical protein